MGVFYHARENRTRITPICTLAFCFPPSSVLPAISLTFYPPKSRIAIFILFPVNGEDEMLNDFKTFIMRGNVMDLAVAVIIGAAFGKIVTSLVDDMIMPLVGLIIGGINFSGLTFTVGSAKVTYGNFIQNIVDFLIIALVIFLMVKAISSLQKPAPAAAASSKECPHCFTMIPIKATRCPNCTSEL